MIQAASRELRPGAAGPARRLASDPRRERLRLLSTPTRAATMARHRRHPAVPT